MKNKISSKSISNMDKTDMGCKTDETNKTDKRSKDFLKQQLDIYDSLDITYVSVDMTVTYDENKQKLKKEIRKYPTKDDFDNGISTYRNPKKNASYVPTGEKYNLIVLDIDNKDDTIKKFDKFIQENDIDMNTTTIKTINNGLHYYFKPNNEQKKQLKNFNTSLGSVLGLNIDVKYNNGFVYGVSKVEYDDTFKKYKIINQSKIKELPDILFKEIIRKKVVTKTKQPNQLTREDEDEDEPKLVFQNELSNEVDIRLMPYLNTYKKYIKTRDEWLKIGTIIYNEGGSIELFNRFSKEFPDHYDENGLKTTWKGIKKSKNACNLHTLKNMIDSKINDGRKTVYDLEIMDTKGIIDNMYDLGMVSDTHIAQIFYSLNSNNFMFISEAKKWYSINNYGIWEEEGDENMKARRLINSSLKSYLINDNKDRLCNAQNESNTIEETKAKKMFENLNKYLNKTVNKKNIITELATLYEKSKLYEQLDTKNAYAFGFSNGVYDLKNDIFRNAKPEELITCTTGYEYKPAPKNKIKAVDNIFNDIFPDKSECSYIKKVLSLGLLADNPLEEFYVFIGTGSNGKGVISTFSKAMLGKHYDTMDIAYLSKSAQTNSAAADPVMARKKNVRLVITSEPESSIKLREGKLKELSGRDSIQCRDLYQGSFNFTPYFKLIIQTNWAPEIDGSDMGMKRRLRLIHFPNKFVETPVQPNERKLDYRVKSDFPKDEEMLNAYFTILLESFRELRDANFKLEFPERFKTNTKNFFSNNDPTGEFIKSCCEVTATGNTKSMDLYTAFSEYCTDNGLDKISHKKFSEILSNKGHTPKKSNGTMKYTTITIIEKPDDDDDDDLIG